MMRPTFASRQRRIAMRFALVKRLLLLLERWPSIIASTLATFWSGPRACQSGQRIRAPAAIGRARANNPVITQTRMMIPPRSEHDRTAAGGAVKPPEASQASETGLAVWSRETDRVHR